MSAKRPNVLPMFLGYTTMVIGFMAIAAGAVLIAWSAVKDVTIVAAVGFGALLAGLFVATFGGIAVSVATIADR